MRLATWLLPWLLCGSCLAAEIPAEPILVVKPDAHKTLVNPNCSHCRDEAKRRATELRGDDQALCWIRGYSDGGVIPYRFFLNPYRVISDSYGVFVYDPDAGFARAFSPSYLFTFHGWRNGVMVMKHKDGTLYSCLTGLAFDGPKKGTRLQTVPAVVSTWGDWLERYPGAVAYHMFSKYEPQELATTLDPDSTRSRPAVDKRLPGDQPVLGVYLGDKARAYPLDRLEAEGLIQDKIAGKTVIVLSHAATHTAAAFLPEASRPRKYSGPRPNGDGISPVDPEPDTAMRRVTLELDRSNKTAPFVDRETKSRWDVAGRAVEGELKGWTLTWIDSTQVKWFAWAAELPETTIYEKR